MTADTHIAAVLHGAQAMHIETKTTAPPKPDEVQIRIRATGICGTDMHYYQAGKNGMFLVRQPLVLGHEAAGKIVAAGNNVQQFQVGDRVAIEPQRPCKECKVCKSGRYNVCPRLLFTGSASADPPVQGSLQELYNHPAGFVHKTPDSITFEEGALLEPLSVSLHAVRRSGAGVGQSVLVLGAGAIGLLCASLGGSSSRILIRQGWTLRLGGKERRERLRRRLI
jgi:L-iditol 2-dehydrogenase